MTFFWDIVFHVFFWCWYDVLSNFFFFYSIGALYFIFFTIKSLRTQVYFQNYILRNYRSQSHVKLKVLCNGVSGLIKRDSHSNVLLEYVLYDGSQRGISALCDVTNCWFLDLIVLKHTWWKGQTKEMKDRSPHLQLINQSTFIRTALNHNQSALYNLRKTNMASLA